MNYEQQEQSLELKKLKDFLLDHVPCSPDAVQQYEAMSVGRLFDVYETYINETASFENFQKIALIEKITKEDYLKDSRGCSLYVEYLAGKLPKELVLRQQIKAESDLNISPAQIDKRLLRLMKDAEDNIDLDLLSYDALESLHENRERAGHRMIVGYHISPNPIDTLDPMKNKIPGVIIKDGQEVNLAPNSSFYSISRTGLYNNLNGYLTIVEGDQYEINQEKSERGDIHGGGQWIASRREILPLFESLKLSNVVISELGLKASSYSK